MLCGQAATQRRLEESLREPYIWHHASLQVALSAPLYFYRRTRIRNASTTVFPRQEKFS